MHDLNEIEKVYDQRYSIGDQKLNQREFDLYAKYRELLLHEVTGKLVANLDLGCGRGHKTLGFSHGFRRVLAIDLSSTVIDQCRSLHKRQNIEFQAVNALEIKEDFNLITAFGFSLFNTKDNERFLEIYDHFYHNNLVLPGTFIIGSFTDFSGEGEQSWYLHTKADLSYLQSQIEANYKAKVELVFPHRKLSNYFGHGFYNFIAEMGKLILKRKKTFFICVKHG